MELGKFSTKYHEVYSIILKSLNSHRCSAAYSSSSACTLRKAQRRTRFARHRASRITTLRGAKRRCAAALRSGAAVEDLHVVLRDGVHRVPRGGLYFRSRTAASKAHSA